MRTAIFCMLAMLAATAHADPTGLHEFAHVRIGHITTDAIPACQHLFEATQLVQFIADGDDNDYKQTLADDMGNGDCSVMHKGQTVYVGDSDNEQGFDFLSVWFPAQSTHWWIVATAVK